jgi:NAD(P)H dehydrogenase (quinone)
MKLKNILLINAHPREDSLTHLLADTYEKAAKISGHTVERLNIRDLHFDLTFSESHFGEHLEPDIIESQRLISWSEHIVIITPVWWMGVPALFKGWLDRTLTSGFAFKYRNNSLIPTPKRLLLGRSARIIYTQGGPRYLTDIIGFDAFYKTLKYGTLIFCGISPVRRTVFARVFELSEQRVTHMLNTITALGKRGK